MEDARESVVLDINQEHVFVDVALMNVQALRLVKDCHASCLLAVCHNMLF